MVSPQGGKSRIRRAFDLMTSSEPGVDEFGARSCAAFLVSATLFWVPRQFEILAHGDRDSLILFVLTVVWFLAVCGTVLLGVVFAVAGIGRAIREKRVPVYSIIGLILNVTPGGFLFLVLFLRA